MGNILGTTDSDEPGSKKIIDVTEYKDEEIIGDKKYPIIRTLDWRQYDFKLKTTIYYLPAAYILDKLVIHLVDDDQEKLLEQNPVIDLYAYGTEFKIRSYALRKVSNLVYETIEHIRFPLGLCGTVQFTISVPVTDSVVDGIFYSIKPNTVFHNLLSKSQIFSLKYESDLFRVMCVGQLGYIGQIHGSTKI